MGSPPRLFSNRLPVFVFLYYTNGDTVITGLHHPME
jgi:hypothetical protein